MFWKKLRLVVEEKKWICQCNMPHEVVLRGNKDLSDVSNKRITAAVLRVIAKDIIPLLGEEFLEGAAQLPDVTDVHTELAEFFLHGWGVLRGDHRKLVVHMNCPCSVVADSIIGQITKAALVKAMAEALADTEPMWDGSLPYAEA